MTFRFISAALLAGVSLAAAPVAFAQVASGIGVANVELVIRSSAANREASQALVTTYKAQIDAFNARKLALRNQLKPLADKIIADQKVPTPNNAAIQAEYQQYQQIQQTGTEEAEQIVQPVKLANQFAIEQIQDKLADATQAAMTKRHITLVLAEQAVLKSDTAYNMNQDIIDQLNLIVPRVSVTPPVGWMPREQRERAAQEQAAAAAEAAQSGATPAKKQPQGR